MKYKFVFTFVTTILCLSLTCCNSITENKTSIPPLAFDISSEKQTYYMDEYVWLTVTLTNITDENQLVYAKLTFVDYEAPSSTSLSFFQILDLKGNVVLGDNNIRTQINWIPQKEDFVILEPNKSTERSFHLPDKYKFKEAGIYKVFAIYRNSFDPQDVFDNAEDSREAWKGEITSNTITSEIQPR